MHSIAPAQYRESLGNIADVLRTMNNVALSILLIWSDKTSLTSSHFDTLRLSWASSRGPFACYIPPYRECDKHHTPPPPHRDSWARPSPSSPAPWRRLGLPPPPWWCPWWPERIRVSLSLLVGWATLNLVTILIFCFRHFLVLVSKERVRETAFIP